jgi:hypothetical protein
MRRREFIAGLGGAAAGPLRPQRNGSGIDAVRLSPTSCSPIS